MTYIIRPPPPNLRHESETRKNANELKSASLLNSRALFRFFLLPPHTAAPYRCWPKEDALVLKAAETHPPARRLVSFCHRLTCANEID